ncbi:MAG: hypothetical protein K8T10_06205 [Candidatus Eremiobacteraeota bacterium]|nr:hypothetical protein [Candidatus Eremiobacteraeota bacterium]
MNLDPIKTIASKISSLPGLRKIFGKKEVKESATKESATKEREEADDSFVPGSPAYEKERDRISSLLGWTLYRIPTLTKTVPKEERKKIMDVLKPGDIILETEDAYPISQWTEKVMFGTDYTHAAVYEGNGYIIESVKDGVKRTHLDYYFDRTCHFAVIRPPYKSKKDVKASIAYARNQIGKLYDTKFSMKDDSRHYCHELVKWTMESIPHPIKVPVIRAFGFTSRMISAKSFAKIDGAKMVYSSKHKYWKSMLSRLPFHLSAIAGAVAGGITLGPLGAIAGYFGAGALYAAIGNKMQTGQFSIYPKDGH